MKLRKIKTQAFTWIDIEKPTKEAVEKIGAEYGFHALDVEDALNKTERPNVDRRDDYVFLMLRFPFYSRVKKTFVIKNINFFVSDSFLISIHDKSLGPIKEIFDDCEEGSPPFPHTFDDTAHLLYTLLRKSFSECFLMLDHISKDINSIEDRIFQGHEREMVKDISVIKRNVIDFRRVMWPQREILQTMSQKIFTGSVKIYYEDLIDNIERIWQVLQEQKETIESLETTNESLISNKTNNIIKILTTFSVIILPLTLIAGIYGMNIETLPYRRHPLSFWIILASMLIIVILMLGYFRKRKWI